MATQLSEAWSSLESGQFRDAQQAFRNAVRSESNATFGYLGLAAAALGTGNLRDAASFAERSLEESHTPEAHLLLGEVHSRNGNRSKAEDHLTDYLSSGGESPYARALLGEQRIRTARWDQGLEDYVEALSRDVDGRAYRQLQGVMADLTEVVANGRLPPKPAVDFVDRLEANLSQPPPNADRFFSSVRRALSNKSTIADPGDGDTILELVGPAQLPEGGSAGGPPTSSGPPASSSPPPTEASDQGDSESEDGIDAKHKDLAAVIQQDRAENEQLQEQIGSMPPPDWPSSPEYGAIDPLPRMDYEEQSIFAGDPGMDATDFRITSGNVRSEIFLERCLQNLLAGASEDRAIAIRYRPETITQIEINCWDGLLDRLPEMSPIYTDF
ncbi:MAG: tetratricopeptide repeat protein, partial [Bradymonadaceae bacterium]